LYYQNDFNDVGLKMVVRKIFKHCNSP